MQKLKSKNNKIWICQRLPKNASNPNWVAQNFGVEVKEMHLSQQRSEYGFLKIELFYFQ
jgi:hypothetical protein